MMNQLDIWLLALALAMDCTTVMMAMGLQNGRLSTRWHVIRASFYYGLFQAMMPLAGWCAVSFFAASLERVGHWVAFVLLVFIGVRMIVDTFKSKQPSFANISSMRIVLLMAVATSIDALAVGVSMAVTGYRHLSMLTWPIVVIGFTSFVLSIAGFIIGRWAGYVMPHWLKPESVGGIILILLGFKVLL